MGFFSGSSSFFGFLLNFNVVGYSIKFVGIQKLLLRGLRLSDSNENGAIG